MHAHCLVSGERIAGRWIISYFELIYFRIANHRPDSLEEQVEDEVSDCGIWAALAN